MEYQGVNYVDSNICWGTLWCSAWSLVCIANYSEITHEYLKSPFNLCPVLEKGVGGFPLARG